jgi:hypothetical protein
MARSGVAGRNAGEMPTTRADLSQRCCHSARPSGCLLWPSLPGFPALSHRVARPARSAAGVGLPLYGAALAGGAASRGRDGRMRDAGGTDLILQLLEEPDWRAWTTTRRC